MSDPPGGVYDQAELYCLAFAGPVDGEVDWLLARVPGARSVLEPFCGQARFAEAFAERGLTYVGLDNSAAMLAHAPRGDGITLTVADATDFDLGRRFDLAWCPINSLCHLTREDEILAHLACVRRHLAPGGTYVVEIEIFRHDGPWDQGTPDRSTWAVDQPDGTHVLATVTREECDLASRTCTERAHYRRVRGETILAEVCDLFPMRMWTYEDLLELTRRSGFAIDGVCHNRGSKGRPEVPLDPQLENDGENHYFVLRALDA
jgi:SAM-dependent methyltransferase